MKIVYDAVDACLEGLTAYISQTLAASIVTIIIACLCFLCLFAFLLFFTHPVYLKELQQCGEVGLVLFCSFQLFTLHK